jgi:hypothetical protein
VKGKWYSEKDIKHIENVACQKILILSAAYLMDEMDYSEDKVVEYWDSITRYVTAIKDHTITLDKVCEIITEHTGLEFKRRYKK